MRPRVLNGPLAQAERNGYLVIRMPEATIRDFQQAIFDPNVVGIVIVAHGVSGEIDLFRVDIDSGLPDTVDLIPNRFGPAEKHIDWPRVSPSLRFVVLMACEGLQKELEWKLALTARTNGRADGVAIYGYPGKVSSASLFLLSPLRNVFMEQGIGSEETWWPPLE